MKILKYPESIDPLKMIEHSMLVCPFCHTNKYVHLLQGGNYYLNTVYADKDGKVHTGLRDKLNKYTWAFADCLCGKCKAQWETDLYPYDMALLGGESLSNIVKVMYND